MCSRKLHWFSLAVAATALVLAACRDKQESPAEPPPPTPVSGLAAVPVDATAVIGLDVGALAGSALAGEVMARVAEGAPELLQRIEGVLAACGVEPARDLEQVLFATGRGPSQVLMVVEGALDLTRWPDCVEQSVAPSGGGVEPRRARPRPVWMTRRQDGSAALFFAFGAARTLIVSTSEPWLEAALAGGGGMEADVGHRPVLERLDRGAAIWSFGRLDPELAARFAALVGAGQQPSIQHVFGHLRVSDGLSLELGAVLATAAEAVSAAEFAHAQLETLTVVAQGLGLGGLVSRIRVEVEKDTVFLRLTLSAEDLKETLSQIDRAAGGE